MQTIFCNYSILDVVKFLNACGNTPEFAVEYSKKKNSNDRSNSKTIKHQLINYSIKQSQYQWFNNKCESLYKMIKFMRIARGKMSTKRMELENMFASFNDMNRTILSHFK